LGRIFGVLGPTAEKQSSHSAVKELLDLLPNLADATLDELVSNDETIAELLLMEHSRYDTLLKVVRESLLELESSLDASARSEASHALENDVARANVPAAWRRVSYPTCKPLGAFVRDLRQRVTTIDEWKLKLPHVFWLPAVFFPHSFIIAQCQIFLRKGNKGRGPDAFRRKEQLEDVEMTYVFKESLDEMVQSTEKLYVGVGVLIYGLVYDGASWNPGEGSGGHLDEPRAVYNELPVLHALPKLKRKELASDADESGTRSATEGKGLKSSTATVEKKPKPMFICPIYNTPDRMGPVVGQLAHEIKKDRLGVMRYKLRGVVALCQTDD